MGHSTKRFAARVRLACGQLREAKLVLQFIRCRLKCVSSLKRNDRAACVPTEPLGVTECFPRARIFRIKLNGARAGDDCLGIACEVREHQRKIQRAGCILRRTG